MATHPEYFHWLSASLGRYLLIALVASMALPEALAQSSNNSCANITTNPTKKYPVMTSCYPLAFNKPNSYTPIHNPGGCNATLNDDAYAWFTATSTSTTITYQPSSNANAILHVLSSCTGPGHVIACADNTGNGGAETVTIATVIGQDYIIRVQRKNTNSAMNGTICIQSPSTCDYRLTLYDSNGDGWGDIWGQAYVDVFVNGVLIGSYTLTAGPSGYIDIPVIDGDLVQVVFGTTGWGYMLDENSFDMSVDGQCIFSTYSPPNRGVPYTTEVNCTPTAAALPQDCVGGVTVCSNESITGNNATTGCEMDLNPSNCGCLLSGERQGSWYFFSPSSSGTLGFTLVPHGPTDDYDFALWGPYDVVQCPNNPPARCSYYDGRYYGNTTTGMGNGATHTSEGAYRPPQGPDPNASGWVRTMNVVAGKIYVLYIDNWSSTGQAFDLTWQLTNGASLNCSTLPVELLSLEATARSPVIDVSWATATERDADHYEVQRSADNETFTTIGKVAAAGNAQYQSNYLFVDEAPLQGVNYYRLRQVDRDGTGEYTKTVVAFMGQGADSRPVIFPNPAKEVLNVVFNTPLEGSAVLYVQDALGRAVTQSTVVLLRGERTAVIPTPSLARGWYHLRIVQANGAVTLTQGFVKE